MPSVFLGTGAAELYPNPFCACPVCSRARQSQETRLRSAFLLDPQTMIDFGPDVCAASQRCRTPLDQVEHVLVTHTHEDHFSDATFSVLTMTKLCRPIHFYISEQGLAWVDRLMAETAHIPGTFGNILSTLKDRGCAEFHSMKPYQPYEIAGKQVTALATNHQAYGPGETARNYLVDWARGRWLYACDTGLYGQETLDFLEDWAKSRHALDVMVTEGTMGSIRQDDHSGHMDGYLLCRQLTALRDRGVVDENTRVYVTHINQVQEFSHAEYQDFLDRHAPVRAIVAHDGMRI